MTTNNRREFLKYASAASAGAMLPTAGSPAAQTHGAENVAQPAPSTDNPFDVVHDRRGTNSIKWDFAYDGGVNDEVAYGAAVDATSGPLPMSLSDMEFQTSPKIIEALENRARHGIYGYTKPTRDYFRSITSWISSHYGWHVEEDWLLKTAGVMPAISMAIQAYTDPGDQIIIQTPVFYPFGTVVENNGRVLLRNSLLLEDEKYVIDFDDLEQKASDPLTKMIIFCSPHNPVGRVWTRRELMRLGEICEQHDLLIVSDEIHCDLVYSWAEFTTFGVVDERFLDRLIVCNSPSKSFNLPGLKTATAIIPNPELRAGFNIELRNMEQLFSDNIFGTLALQTAYEQGDPWLGQLKAYLEANYLYLKKYIDDHLPAMRLQEAEGLYLVWIDCRELGMKEDELRHLFFDDANVYPVQGGTYGAEGEGFIRLNIACPRQILEEALTRIESAVSRV